jgi:hypothetical protein
MRENIMRELQNGGLSGHFSIYNTRPLVEECYYWPWMAKDVEKWVEGCRVCQDAKGIIQNIGIYTPSMIPKAPWEDINIDFSLGLRGTH